MTKPGDAYQELVAAVRRTLDLGSVVTEGQWVEGPDGRRDMDVWVEGSHEGSEHRILIECKDWSRPVGIEVVDALESKRRDLGAMDSAIYSNMGFTKPAIDKARRVGIQLAFAMKSGDKQVRLGVSQRYVARRLAVDHWQIAWYWPKDDPTPGELDAHTLQHDGHPFIDWLEHKSLELLTAHNAPPLIKAEYAFSTPQSFTYPTGSVRLLGIVLLLQCRESLVAQDIALDVSIGHYDVIKGCVVVPHNSLYEMGPFDPEKWKEVSDPPEEKELEPNSFRIDLTLLRPIAGSGRREVPRLDEQIGESKVTTPDVPDAL
jgi:hypothetical protein